MGIMSVVTKVGTDLEDEREPTWDEAVATLDAAAPVEVVRSPRKVTVMYRYADGIFTATSPEVKGFRTTGRSLHETRRLVSQDLRGFLDPAVEIVERIPAADPEVRTAAVGRGWVNASALHGISVPSSSSGGRAFVSSVRASLRRTRAS